MSDTNALAGTAATGDDSNANLAAEEDQNALSAGVDGSEAGADQNGDQEQETPEAKLDRVTKAKQKQIDRLSRKRHEERGRREAAETRAEALDAELRKLRGDTGAPTTEQLVEKAVESRLSAKEYNARCTEIYDAAVEADPKFDAAYRQLPKGMLFTSKGPTAVMDLLTESDHASDILIVLTKDDDTVEDLLDATPLKAARIIARLEAEIEKRPAKPGKPVSKSGAPVTPVGARGSGNAGDSKPGDKDDMLTWMKKRNAQVRGK